MDSETERTVGSDEQRSRFRESVFLVFFLDCAILIWIFRSP